MTNLIVYISISIFLWIFTQSRSVRRTWCCWKASVAILINTTLICRTRSALNIILYSVFIAVEITIILTCSWVWSLEIFLTEELFGINPLVFSVLSEMVRSARLLSRLSRRFLFTLLCLVFFFCSQEHQIITAMTKMNKIISVAIRTRVKLEPTEALSMLFSLSVDPTVRITQSSPSRSFGHLQKNWFVVGVVQHVPYLFNGEIYEFEWYQTNLDQSRVTLDWSRS